MYVHCTYVYTVLVHRLQQFSYWLEWCENSPYIITAVIDEVICDALTYKLFFKLAKGHTLYVESFVASFCKQKRQKHWEKPAEEVCEQHNATNDVKFSLVWIPPIIRYIHTRVYLGTSSVSTCTLHYISVFADPLYDKTHSFQQNLA